MPHYEYFHIPGMDWLGAGRIVLPALQLCSAAHQLGKKEILSESFGMCGHNISFEELKSVFEWQAVRGVNLLRPHLEGYSLRGLRKRDYPPAMRDQQPWWNKYKIFNDTISRLGTMVGNGTYECDTLVIHPQSAAWIAFDAGENKGLSEILSRLDSIIETLDAKHIPFHFGDETIIERHGRVEGNCL